MFTNECLGELAYEATTSAVVMAGIFLSFLVEYIGQRVVRAKVRSEAALTLKEQSQALLSSEIVGILVMEAGIVFHSLRTFLFSSPSSLGPWSRAVKPPAC
jgi:zinc transporter 1/2/3